MVESSPSMHEVVSFIPSTKKRIFYSYHKGVALSFKINPALWDPPLDPSPPSGWNLREEAGRDGEAFGRRSQAPSLMHKTGRPFPPQLIKTSGPEIANEAFGSFPLQMRRPLCSSPG